MSGQVDLLSESIEILELANTILRQTGKLHSDPTKMRAAYALACQTVEQAIGAKTLTAQVTKAVDPNQR